MKHYDRLREHLQPGYDEAEIHDGWRRIADKRNRVPSGWRIGTFAVAAVAAAALVVGVVIWKSSGDRRVVPALAASSSNVSLEAGSLLPVMQQTQTVALNDGSTLELAPQAQLRVVGNEGARFVTQLQQGKVHFAVKPHGPRRWEIETGLATVEVVGTEFGINVDQRGVSVEVVHGVVVVRGERVPDRLVRLTAGQSLQIERATVTASVPPPALPPALPPAPGEAVPVAADEIDSAVVSSRTPNQRSVAVAPPVAAVVPVPSQPTLAAVLAEVDQVRLRDTNAAIDMLSRALATHTDDAAYGLAAFTLGRLALEAGRYVTAAAAFERVIAAAAPFDLVGDAYARRAEALLRGKLPGAAVAMQRLIEKYPQHPRRAMLEALANVER